MGLDSIYQHAIHFLFSFCTISRKSTENENLLFFSPNLKKNVKYQLVSNIILVVRRRLSKNLI